MANFSAKNTLLFGDGVENLHGEDGRTVLAVDDVGEGLAFFAFRLIFR